MLKYHYIRYILGLFNIKSSHSVLLIRYSLQSFISPLKTSGWAISNEYGLAKVMGIQSNTKQPQVL